MQIDSIHLAIGVGALVGLVPTGNGNHSPAQTGVQLDRILRHVAKALDAGRGVLRTDAQLFQCLSQREYDAVASRLGAAERSTHVHGLAGDEAGITAAMDLLELVEYPEHVLRVGHDVRRRHIGNRTDIPGHLPHPAAADLLLFA